MKRVYSKTWPYLLILPALAIVSFVVLYPAAQSVVLSFQNFNYHRPHEMGFTGIQNYIDVFKDKLFWQSLRRTIIWDVLCVGLQFVLGFMLALLLNTSFPGRGAVRSVSLVPWVMPGVLVGLMWRWILDGNYGVLNDILMKIGLIQNNIAFLAQTETAFSCAILAEVWRGIPFFALMILAGLQAVSVDLQEAAKIDGASAIQRFFYITVPSIENIIRVTLMLRIIWVSNAVDLMLNLTGGGPAYSSQTLSVYIFNTANNMNFGYASTMAVILTLCLLVVAIPYVRGNMKEEE